MAHKEYSELLFKRPYTGVGQEPETPEFVVLVLPEEFQLWKADHSKVPLVEVVDSMEVFIAEHRAHTGKLQHPSNAQLDDAFGTHKFEEIFAIMAEQGHLIHAPKHADFRREEGG
jgi:ribosome maturation protein Sdo1